MAEIELFTTEALLLELLGRFDHAVFAGMKIRTETADGECDMFESYHKNGNPRTCQGLGFKIIHECQVGIDERYKQVDDDDPLR